ncbi:MAG TPA: PIN domain-containing protein [Acidimicrobiales bacterium]|nr:PIN domain-containing protein [Acidimicrobiales bacterium]
MAAGRWGHGPAAFLGESEGLLDIFLRVSGPGGQGVVDTNVFGAELTRRGAALADAYRGHVEGRSLFIFFVAMAEISYGARLAQWGELRLRSLEARLGAAEIVWAGSGLVDAYVSVRQECAVSGHVLGQKHHEADRWVAATAR